MQTSVCLDTVLCAAQENQGGFQLLSQRIKKTMVRLEKWLLSQFLRQRAESIRATKEEQAGDKAIALALEFHSTTTPTHSISLSWFVFIALPVSFLLTSFLINLCEHALVNHTRAHTLHIACTHSLRLIYNSGTLSLIHTRPPSTSAHYLFLICLPLSRIILIPLFSHLLLIGAQIG